MGQSSKRRTKYYTKYVRYSFISYTYPLWLDDLLKGDLPIKLAGLYCWKRESKHKIKIRFTKGLQMSQVNHFYVYSKNVIIKII